MPPARRKEKKKFDSKVDRSLEYVKTKILAIFSLFSISNSDSGTLLAAIESVDTHFKQHVNVHAFALKFIPQFSDVLVIIWEKYAELLGFPKPVNHVGHGAHQPTKPAAAKTTEEAELGHNYYKNPDYFHFIAFLLLLNHLQDKELTKLLYYLFFYIPKVKITREELCKFVHTMWLCNKDGNSVEAWRVKKSQKYYGYMLKALKYTLDFDEFNALKFGIYDMASSRAWSRPVVNMRAELRWNIGGFFYWGRLSKQVNIFLRSNDIDKILESKFDDSKHAKKKLHVDYFIERKHIRKETRKYLKVFKQFLEMPIGERHITDKKGIFHAIGSFVITVGKKAGKIISEKYAKIGPKEELFSQLQSSFKLEKRKDYSKFVKVEKVLTEEERDEMIVLQDKLNKKALKLSAEVLASRAQTMKEMTKNLLDLTKAEVIPIESIIQQTDAPSFIESKDNGVNDDLDSVSSSDSESSYSSRGSDLTEESFSSINTKNKLSPIQITSITE